MTPDALLGLIARRAAPAVLDVRTSVEFGRGHVPGALHIPFHQVSSRAAEIQSPPEAPLIVYCGHGPRAWIAGRALRARGFSQIIYLKGHWAGWTRAGLPRERG